MIITITTDASFHRTKQLGSYAFWIKCNQGKIAKAGVLKDPVSRPEQAEFKCIINAVYMLIMSGYTDVNKIIINTDCLNVIHICQDNKGAIRKYGLKWGIPLKKKLQHMLHQSKYHKAVVEFRHVKAHESTATPRQWVNDWCDQEAKRVLAAHINNLK